MRVIRDTQKAVEIFQGVRSITEGQVYVSGSVKASSLNHAIRQAYSRIHFRSKIGSILMSHTNIVFSLVNYESR